ncbi:MAG: cupin domain-containing protein [Acidimicrobiia bacterium]|nr:cupin domain-containing protein [Acidimicrobiia bacterium]
MTVIGRPELEFIDLPGRRSADPLEAEASASSLRVVQMERTVGRTAHRHPHSEEVVVVAAGQGRAWIDGEWFPVAAGDVVLIPAGVAHATVPDENSQLELICFFPHPNLSKNIEDTTTQVS